MPTTITRLNPASAKIVIPQSVGRSAPRPLAAWLMLVGVLIPEAALRIDFGAKLTAGRVGIILLLIPALIELTKNTRRLVPSDFCACALAAWMLVAAAYVDWENSLSSAGAECLEFVGGYFVARGLLFGTAAIDTFIRVLKIVAAIAILLGFADTLSGRWIVYDTFVGVSLTADYRLDGVVRALSTFDHPILFGTFCTVSGIIFLFSERTTSLRMRWSIFCFLGCLSALSSAPLLSFLIGFGVRAYDLLLRQFAWRWMVLWSVVMVATPINHSRVMGLIPFRTIFSMAQSIPFG